MRRVFVSLAAFVPLVLLAAFAPPAGETADAASAKPNVIVVMTDDQPKLVFGRNVMPHTFRTFGPENGGTRFVRGYAVPPLCCPARAGFLTGQYPHNHGVLWNNYGLLEDKENVLPAWLREAGYKTALVGKHLNNYERAITGGVGVSDEIPIPPGFDYAYQTLENRYHGYDVSDNGVRRRHGLSARDYVTNVLNRKAVEFIEDHVTGEEAEKPFFLYLSHFAPHPGRNRHRACGIYRTPEPMNRDWRRWRRSPVRLGPAVNEADISDKPDPVRRYRPLSARKLKRIVTRVRCARAAMAPVDRGIRAIYDKLVEHDLFEDTIFFFVSDNGLFNGEHRIELGKNRPYREALEVPFLARIPAHLIGRIPPATVRQPAGTFDLAPTIMDLVGLGESQPRTFDGLSLRPALEGQELDRRALLFEQRGPCRKYSSVLEVESGLLYSVWFRRFPVGEECRVLGRELYDLDRDPAQLRNLLAKPRRWRGRLPRPWERRRRERAMAEAKRLEQLRGELAACAGEDCR